MAAEDLRDQAHQPQAEGYPPEARAAAALDEASNQPNILLLVLVGLMLLGGAFLLYANQTGKKARPWLDHLVNHKALLSKGQRGHEWDRGMLQSTRRFILAGSTREVEKTLDVELDHLPSYQEHGLRVYAAHFVAKENDKSIAQGMIERYLDDREEISIEFLGSNPARDPSEAAAIKKRIEARRLIPGAEAASDPDPARELLFAKPGTLNISYLPHRTRHRIVGRFPSVTFKEPLYGLEIRAKDLVIDGSFSRMDEKGFDPFLHADAAEIAIKWPKVHDGFIPLTKTSVDFDLNLKPEDLRTYLRNQEQSPIDKDRLKGLYQALYGTSQIRLNLPFGLLRLKSSIDEEDILLQASIQESLLGHYANKAYARRIYDMIRAGMLQRRGNFIRGELLFRDGKFYLGDHPIEPEQLR